MPDRTPLVLVMVLVTTALLLQGCSGGERIKALVIGQIGLAQSMEQIFSIEPSIIYSVVVADDGRLTDDELRKQIRLYFPRRQEDIEEYDFIMLLHVYWLAITAKQDNMIYDAIEGGAGAINDGSVFSIVPPTPGAWAASRSQQAFPNDAPAVVERKFDYATMAYSVKINRDFPDPVLTSFLPFGVENVAAMGATRMVIGRQGAGTLAWIIGPFPWRSNAELLVAWDYGKGRTMTSAEYLPTGWFAYPTAPGPQVNQYAADILMNMVFYATRRNLIDDVVVFHRLKSSLAEYKARMAVLFSLRDFIDKFGARTDRIQEEVMRLETFSDEMIEHYLNQEFVRSEGALLEALELFPEVEEIARREKDAALLWVYVIEWLVTSSTFFIAGFILWSLMVRRRLYRAVAATKLRSIGDAEP